MRPVRTRARAILGGAALVLALAGPLAAAPAAQAPAATTRPSQVEGSVVDREGTGVVGATVVARQVLSMGTVQTYETVTGPEGHFQLDGLPPGTYWFVAFHGDYPTGTSPAVPVVDEIEIAIQLDDDLTDA